MVCSFRAGALAHYFSLPSLFSQPTLFHHLFVAKKVAKSAGLVLAAGRSNARFTKPLKTHSSSLHPVAPRAQTLQGLQPLAAVAAQLDKNVDGRCGGPDPGKGLRPFIFRSYIPLFSGARFRIGLNARSHDGDAVIWFPCPQASLLQRARRTLKNHSIFH